MQRKKKLTQYFLHDDSIIEALCHLVAYSFKDSSLGCAAIYK